MNDALFSNSFYFRTITHDRFHYTDNRSGSPSHYFAMMLNGRFRITDPSGSVEVREGEIFYIPKGVSYQSYWYGEPEVRLISLGFQFLPNFERHAYPAQVVPFDEAAAGLFRQIAAAPRLSAREIGMFYTLVAMLLPQMTYRTPCRTRQIVENTRQYLTEHPHARAAELAKHSAISEAALYAAFQKASDVTLSGLRSQLLLESARDLLISTDQPVEAVSDELGFSSASYFRKKFKAHFGVTPGEMRKKYRI